MDVGYKCLITKSTKVNFHSQPLWLCYNQNVIDYSINKTLNICHKGEHAHYQKNVHCSMHTLFHEPGAHSA